MVPPDRETEEGLQESEYKSFFLYKIFVFVCIHPVLIVLNVVYHDVRGGGTLVRGRVRKQNTLDSRTFLCMRDVGCEVGL